MTRDITREEWAAMVAATIADHPNWMAATMAAVQSGAAEAIERQKDRIADLSLGLLEALKDRRSPRRDSARVVRAIQVSQFYPTQWSARQIAREERKQS